MYAALFDGDNDDDKVNHYYDDEYDKGDITHLFEKINKPSMLLLLSSCNNTSCDGVLPWKEQFLSLFFIDIKKLFSKNGNI